LTPPNDTSRRWPAEWEPQAAVWFSWPHRRETWPGHYPPIPEAFARMVRKASEYLPVRVLAADKLAVTAQAHLGPSASIEICDLPTNDCWIRDYGPTFVVEDNELIGISWRFNAWGGKYAPWDKDAAAAQRICERIGVRCEPSPLGLEGGAIETDGQGRLMVTPGCIETATRNPDWTRQMIAEEWKLRLGIEQVLWVDGGGLEGDDTDGHIDQLARFVDPQNVVCAVSDNSRDVNHVGLEANFKQLNHWGQQTQPKVTIHRLPIPPARYIDDNRVPESYTNFLMLGGRAVLVPTFRHTRFDEAALGLLRDLLPGQEIVPVDAYDFAWGLGAWHCASQQQPAIQAASL